MQNTTPKHIKTP